MEIDDILEKYGSYGRTGRVVFKHHAYVMVAKKLGGDWNKMSPNEKVFLKGEMIDQYAGTGSINEERFVRNRVPKDTEALLGLWMIFEEPKLKKKKQL